MSNYRIKPTLQQQLKAEQEGKFDNIVKEVVEMSGLSDYDDSDLVPTNRKDYRRTETPVSTYTFEEVKKAIKNKKPIETSFFEIEDFIFEQIRCERCERCDYSRDANLFIKYSKSDERTEIINDFEHNGILYWPIKNKLADLGAILLPSKIEEYESDDKLVKEISDFLFTYFEPPKYYEGILPYLVLFYWISDRFPFVPYLHFVGLTGTGKSTALETFGSISYKSINASGAITIASIFRLAHQWKGTLLLDEFDLGNKNSESYGGMLQLLRSGVSDKPVFRTEGDRKKEVELYQIKSPRIFSSQNPIVDAALQSRTIVVKMAKNTKAVPLYRLDNFYKKAQSLRNKLLLWRFRNLNSVELEKIEYGFKELLAFDGRVQQVLTPIYYLANDSVRKKILDFAFEQEEETKRERLEEIDGQIFLYIYEHSKEDISLSALTESINTKRVKQGYRISYTERKLGNIIRKVLGFATERRRDGYRLIIKQERVEELATYYGIGLIPLEDSQHSQSSQNSGFEANSEDDSDFIGKEIEPV